MPVSHYRHKYTTLIKHPLYLSSGSTVVNLTSAILCQSISEYADYKISRVLTSESLESDSNSTNKNLKQSLSSQNLELTFCEYANYSISRKLNSQNLELAFCEYADYSISRKLNSQNLEQSFLYSVINVSSFTFLHATSVSQAIAEYADYKVARSLASQSLEQSDDFASKNLKQNLSSESILISVSEYANYRIHRNLVSQVSVLAEAYGSESLKSGIYSQVTLQTLSNASWILIGQIKFLVSHRFSEQNTEIGLQREAPQNPIFTNMDYSGL